MNKNILLLVFAVNSNVLCQDSLNSTKSYISRFKNNIVQTIKADLGFTNDLFTGHETQSECLKKQIACAARLFIYHKIILFAGLPLFSLIPGKLQLNNTRLINNTRPNLWYGLLYAYAILFAPLLEEGFFTGILGVDWFKRGDEFYLPGRNYRKLFVPILFGLAHYHKDPKTYLFRFYNTALMSFMHINHANAYAYAAYWDRMEEVLVVPCLHHMFHNLVAVSGCPKWLIKQFEN